MTTTKPTRAPGAGRKRTISPDAPSVVYTMRVSPAQKAKIAALGGGAAVRALIDAAPTPKRRRAAP